MPVPGDSSQRDWYRENDRQPWTVRKSSPDEFNKPRGDVKDPHDPNDFSTPLYEPYNPPGVEDDRAQKISARAPPHMPQGMETPDIIAPAPRSRDYPQDDEYGHIPKEGPALTPLPDRDDVQHMQGGGDAGDEGSEGADIPAPPPEEPKAAIASPEIPPFDPGKPFTPITTAPAKPAEIPAFDPSKPFTPVTATAQPPQWKEPLQGTPDKPYAPKSKADYENWLKRSPIGSAVNVNGTVWTKPEGYESPPSGITAFTRGAVGGVGGAAGGLAGAGAGAALGAEVGAVGGPVGALAGGLVGGAAGAFGLGWVGQKAEDMVVGMLPHSWQVAIGQSPEQKAAAQQAHPYLFEAGGLAPSVVAFSPRAAGEAAAAGAGVIQRMFANPITQRALPAAVMAAQNAVQQVSEGQPIDPASLALAAGAGALMRSPNRLGQFLLDSGARPVETVFGHLRGGPEAVAGAGQQQQPPPGGAPGGPAAGAGGPAGGGGGPPGAGGPGAGGRSEPALDNLKDVAAQAQAKAEGRPPPSPTAAPPQPTPPPQPPPTGAGGVFGGAGPAAPPAAAPEGGAQAPPVTPGGAPASAGGSGGATPTAAPTRPAEPTPPEQPAPPEVPPSTDPGVGAARYIVASRELISRVNQQDAAKRAELGLTINDLANPPPEKAQAVDELLKWRQTLELPSPEDMFKSFGTNAEAVDALSKQLAGKPQAEIDQTLKEVAMGQRPPPAPEPPQTAAEPPQRPPQGPEMPPLPEGWRIEPFMVRSGDTGAPIQRYRLISPAGSEIMTVPERDLQELGNVARNTEAAWAENGRPASQRPPEAAGENPPPPKSDVPRGTEEPPRTEETKPTAGETAAPSPTAAEPRVTTAEEQQAPTLPPPENEPVTTQETHGKTGEPITVVRFPKGRMDFGEGPGPSQFDGYWSPYRGRGFTPGYIFKGDDREKNAANFVGWAGDRLAQMAGPQVTAQVQKAREETEPPSDQQKETGEYQKGAVDFHGIPFRMETPSGKYREGPKDPETGEPAWRTMMPPGVDYGEIHGTKAADGDAVDMFLGPKHDSQQAWVIDQHDPDTGAYDEPKVMGGFENWPTARQAYLDSYSDGRGEERIGNVTPMTIPQVKEWLDSGRTKEPLAKPEPQIAIANRVAEMLAAHSYPGPRTLQQIAEEAYGGTLAEGKFGRQHMYDALELGVNRYVLDHPATYDPRVGLDTAQRIATRLGEVKRSLPTQTVRAGEKDLMQQFSTPPDYAYAAAWAANIQPGRDRVMEPSAGTGSLVAPAMNARPAAMYVNELSANRAPLVESLRPDRAFRENAEQLNNILPRDVQPSVVVMNPPFSSAGERMPGKKILGIGARHIEQALKRMAPGGRLVAIVGRGMWPEAPAFKDWWAQIAREYDVRANVGVPGDVYTKMGTSFGTRLLIIDKNQPSGRSSPVVGDAADIPDLMQRIAEARDDRRPPSEQLAGQPGGGPLAPGGEGGPRPEPTPRPPTDTSGVRAGPSGAGPGPGVSEQPGVGGEPTVRPDDLAGGAGAVAAEQPERPESLGAERLDAAPDGVGVDVAGSSTGPDGTVLRPGGSAGSVLPSGEGAAPLDGPAPEAVKLDEAAVEPDTGGELTENVYEPYRPQRITIAGAKAHPGDLVQSAAMASVLPPQTAYAPRLPKKVIIDGLLSDAQLESTTYAGHAHDQMLPSVEGEAPVRRGYFIGDGTGVGKGREVAGIILDNWSQGRKKAVWLSEKRPLINDAQRDWAGLGGDKGDIFDLAKTKAGVGLKASKGILFTTYDTLKSTERLGKDEAGKTIPGKRRVDQIVEWLGKDFDGVIAFDEAHNMANSIAMKGTRGIKDAAQKALAGIELQELLPNARVVYVSATGATEVSNLAYAERLGLWGYGTAFPTKSAFINEIHSGGIAAMELVARDMKAMGSYIARNLSYDDVKYDRVEHTLSPEQRQIYDDLAEGWQVVLRNIGAALEATGADESPRAKSAALSAFWSAHQRFFNQVITSMQMPSVLSAIEQDLKEGRQAVLQLVNTNEAAQKRAIASAETLDDLEDLDTTPRTQLLQLIEHSFPVFEHESFIDENGNEGVRLVTDSEGNPVENQEAVAMREALLDKLGAIRVPQGPLDMLLDHFGADNVAEVTGRKQQILPVEDENGNPVKRPVSRPSSANVTEADAFQAGKKRILVFSEAGGTGRSYHAENGTGSASAQRSHYLIQAGWRADKAIQGFGRTHRTNQASAPIFHLVTTDLQGQRRFISSIARRLSQLGALTKGERRAGEQGMFSARDNLESREASSALYSLFRDLYFDKVPEIRMAEFEDQTGLKLTDKDGNLKKELPEIPQFLNRLLSLKYDLQNAVFGAFEQRLNDAVDMAAANGTLDSGTETLRADKIVKDEDRVVHTDPQSGAETRYVRLAVSTRTNPATFDEISAGERMTGGREPAFYVTSKGTGRIYAVVEARDIDDRKTGNIIQQYRLVDPLNWKFTERPKIDGAGAAQFWDRVPNEAQARQIWNRQVAAIPEFMTHDTHMITGAILPIWDRLKGSTKVYRTQTQAGERILGRMVEGKDIKATLRALGAEGAMKQYTAAEAVQRIMEGATATLANKWKIKRVTVANEPRIEVTGVDYYSGSELEREGGFKERIDYNTRYFIPTGAEAEKVLGRVLARRPIVDMTGAEESGLAEGAGGPSRRAGLPRDLRDDFAESVRGVADPHEASRQWTMLRGRNTGNEHLVAYDPMTRSVTHAYTMDRPNWVGIAPDLTQEISDPEAAYVLHHNHPSNRPPSLTDIQALAEHPGLSHVVTHGGGGDYWGVGSTPLLRDLGIGGKEMGTAYAAAGETVFQRLHALVDTGKLTPDEAARLYNELVNRSLGAAGLIDYVSSRELSGVALPWVKSVLRSASKAALGAIDVAPLEGKQADALVNRHTNTVLPEAGIRSLPVGDGQSSGSPPGGRGAVPGGEGEGRELPAGAGLAEEAGGGFGGGEPPEPPAPNDPGFPDPEERRVALGEIQHTTHRNWLDSLRALIERVRAGGLLGFRQYWQDQLASLEAHEKRAFGGRLAPGAISPTMSARFAKNWHSTLEVAINHAQVRYNAAEGIVEPIEGSKPFKAIIGQLADEQKRTGRPAVDDYALWSIVRRAKMLKGQNRERNVSQAKIDQFENLHQLYDRPDGTNLFEQVHEELRGWHKNLLDFAEDAGLLNADSRALWEHDDYVPFYRAMGEEGDGRAPGAGGRGIVNARSPISHLEGGRQKVNNIYENMVLNASAIIRRSMANIAAQKAVDMLVANTDAITPMSRAARLPFEDPEIQASLRAAGLDPDTMTAAAKRGAAELWGALKSKDPDVISVMRNGKAQFYRVNDPLLLQSLTAAGPAAMTGLARLLTAPAHLLRGAVVFDPAFMIAHNLRMAEHAFILTGANPIASMTAALRQARGLDPVALRMMAAGAMSGKYDINLPRNVRATIDSTEYRNSLIDTPIKAMKFIQHLGENAMRASDIGPRLAVYDKALRDGASQAEAMNAARDLLDFSTHGSGQAAMFLAQTIPFLNARWQGMARTYRGFMGEERTGILMRGALITAGTLALWAENKDDPEYQRKEDWDRQYAWQIRVGDEWFRIPKPFELGAIFGSLPEIIADYFDNGSTRQLNNATTSMISNVFKFNPVPVAVRPAIEVMTNHDMFTGRPILNDHEQTMAAAEPSMGYGSQVSQSTVAAVQAYNSAMPHALQVTPATMQHLIDGYLAGWGTYITSAADYIGSQAGVLPEEAAPAQMPVVGRFVHEEPEASNRLMTDFYDLKKEITGVGASIKQAQNNGDLELARSLQERNPNWNPEVQKEFSRVGTMLSKIAGQYQHVQANPNMSSEQKTAARTSYYNERDRLLDQLTPFLRSAEGLSASP